MGGSFAPAAVTPMLATPGPVPKDSGWAFEFVWDGMRSLAHVGPDRIRLAGARGELTAGLPEFDVVPALGARQVVLDGKLVALDGLGRPSLPRLQQRMSLHHPSPTARRRTPVTFYAFDVLQVDDRSTLDLPYRRRRELLDGLDLGGASLVVPPYFPDIDGQAMVDVAARYGLPGVVAKRLDSPYLPGRRSRHWVQTTLRHTQEVVVGGWLAGADGRPDALLVGVPTHHGLRYVGRVAHGLTAAVRRDLGARLSGLGRATSPFTNPVPASLARQARWVTPELGGEVRYRRWTAGGLLGYPTWVGLHGTTHPAALRNLVVLPSTVPPEIADPADAQEAGPQDNGSPHSGPQDAETEAAAPDTSGTSDTADIADAGTAGTARLDPARQPALSPHFFYNALSAIAALVASDPDRAQELLIDVAAFTRYTLRPDPEFVLLHEELEIVEHYLAVEQLRLEERLRLDVHVAPQVMVVALPAHALRLVVENAVRNGIETVPGGGTLTLDARAVGGECVITVTATGTATGSELERAGERLAGAFGDGGRLLVEHTGAETTVTLRIPRRPDGSAAPPPHCA